MRAFRLALLATAAAAAFLGSVCGAKNKAPSVPTLTGPSSGIVGVAVTFKAVAADPDADSVAYQFDWGDASALTWTSFIPSGDTATASHTYTDSGSFTIKVKAKDSKGDESEWSAGRALGVGDAGAGFPDSLAEQVFLGGATAMVASQDGSRLYVCQYDDDRIMVMRTADRRFVDTVAVGDWPWGIVRSPDGERVYVTNLEGNSVSVIATANDSVVATMQVGAHPLGIAIAPDGQFLYVACSREDSVAVVNTTSLSVVAKVFVDSGPTEVSLTPDGKWLYITTLHDRAMAVVNTATASVDRRVQLGGRLTCVAVRPDGKVVYAGREDGAFLVVAAETDSVLSTFDLEEGAIQVAFSPDGGYAYAGTGKWGEIPVLKLPQSTLAGRLVTTGNQNRVCASPNGEMVFATDIYRGVSVYVRR